MSCSMGPGALLHLQGLLMPFALLMCHIDDLPQEASLLTVVKDCRMALI